MMKPSAACYALVRKSEGLRLDAYKDSGGVWTVGFGHTGTDVQKRITFDEAEKLLEADINEAADAVNRLALPCTQGQFDALTDFVFNLGERRLAGSSLLRYHRAGKFTLAAAEFGKWVHCGRAILPGLVKRRAAEAHMYLSDELP
jgi:lysozyme